MPYYGSQILKASSLPTAQTIELEALLRREEQVNPHHIYPLSRLISRLVRENSCRWMVDNVTPLLRIESGRHRRASLSDSQLTELARQCFAVALEMIVASELSGEDVYYLFVIKHVLISANSVVELIQDKSLKMELSELNSSIWEIHSAVAARGAAATNTTQSPLLDALDASADSIRGSLTWLLWGQALIRLARSYLVPQGSVGRHEFFQCLDLARQKLQKSFELASAASEKVAPANKRPLLAICTDSLCGIAYVLLQKGRHTLDQTARRQLFVEAKKLFNKADGLLPSQNSTYNLACVAALLDDEYECQQWLTLCARDGTLPRHHYLLQDPDLVPMQTKPWFLDMLRHAGGPVASQESGNNFGVSFHQLSMISPHFAGNAVPPQPANPPLAGAGPVTSAPSPGELQYGAANPALNEVINYDEEMNRLQASLLREGFTMSTVVTMIYEVSKGKQQFQVDSDRIRQAKERLHTRLKAYGMKEKSPIPADGNCQFHSLSDQIFGGTSHSAFIRKKLVEWLRSHADWQLPNGAKMRDFVHDKTWEEYCDEISRDGIWGDHLTLTAAAEYFATRICIISSVEGDNFVTDINPSLAKSPKVLFLSHYAEYHYGSLMKAR